MCCLRKKSSFEFADGNSGSLDLGGNNFTDPPCLFLNSRELGPPCGKLRLNRYANRLMRVGRLFVKRGRRAPTLHARIAKTVSPLLSVFVSPHISARVLQLGYSLRIAVDRDAYLHCLTAGTCAIHKRLDFIVDSLGPDNHLRNQYSFVIQVSRAIPELVICNMLVLFHEFSELSLHGRNGLVRGKESYSGRQQRCYCANQASEKPQPLLRISGRSGISEQANQRGANSDCSGARHHQTQRYRGNTIVGHPRSLMVRSFAVERAA